MSHSPTWNKLSYTLPGKHQVILKREGMSLLIENSAMENVVHESKVTTKWEIFKIEDKRLPFWRSFDVKIFLVATHQQKAPTFGGWDRCCKSSPLLLRIQSFISPQSDHNTADKGSGYFYWMSQCLTWNKFSQITRKHRTTLTSDRMSLPIEKVQWTKCGPSTPR